MKNLFNILTLNFIFILSIQASLLEDLPEIKYETFKLDNGLTVIVHEDKKVPMVAVNVWYHVGSKNEKVGKTGFAHLFEHLMFNGTENYNSEYFEPFEKIGSTDQNGTTSKFEQQICFQLVAELLERLTLDHKVSGSNPSSDNIVFTFLFDYKAN